MFVDRQSDDTGQERPDPLLLRGGLRRLLAATPPFGRGHEVLVIDPASLLVNRRARRAKTDRLDAKAMARALIAYGEDQVLQAVHVRAAA